MAYNIYLKAFVSLNLILCFDIMYEKVQCLSIEMYIFETSCLDSEVDIFVDVNFPCFSLVRWELKIF